MKASRINSTVRFQSGIFYNLKTALQIQMLSLKTISFFVALDPRQSSFNATYLEQRFVAAQTAR
jgi:hypothetical protein